MFNSYRVETDLKALLRCVLGLFWPWGFPESDKIEILLEGCQDLLYCFTHC